MSSLHLSLHAKRFLVLNIAFLKLQKLKILRMTNIEWL